MIHSSELSMSSVCWKFLTLKQSHILVIQFQHWPSIYRASCKDEIRMSHNLAFWALRFFIFFQSPVYGTLLIHFAYFCIPVNFYFPPTCMGIRGYKTNFLPSPSSVFSWYILCYCVSKLHHSSSPSHLASTVFLCIGEQLPDYAFIEDSGI